MSVTTSAPICDAFNLSETDAICSLVQSAPIEATCPGGAVVLGGGENRTFVPTKFTASGTIHASNFGHPQDTDSGPASNGLGWDLSVWHIDCSPGTRFETNCWNYTVTAVCSTGTTSGEASRSAIDTPKGVAQRLPHRRSKVGKDAAGQTKKGR